MLLMAAGNLINTVNRVSFPLFSAMQHDNAGLKRAVRKSLGFVAFLCFPLMVGLACVALPLIRVLLTDKWLPCVKLLQIFCISGALWPLHSIHSYNLMALGKADLFFRLEAIKKTLGVTAIALTYHFGVAGLVWGDAGANVVCCFIYAYYAAQMISYSWWEQILDIIPYLSLSIAMAVPVLAVNLLGIRSVVAVLVLQIATGVAVYGAGSFLFRLSAFEDIRGFIQSGIWSFANPPAVDS
jgi:O-antigen/teichoic acid export membrane protein